jgi:TonB family protein
MSRFRNRPLASLYLLSMFLCILPVSLRAKGPASSQDDSIQVHYPNTKDGLRLFLQAVLAATQENNLQKVSELIRQTEIPNDHDWFFATYPADKAESWVGPYEKDLKANEESFRQRFAKFASSKGQISIRKVNDEPEPGRGLEWGLLNSANKPLDYYFANWKTSTDEIHGVPIGYFVFIDGMFRWDSLIAFPKIALLKIASDSKPREEKESPLSGPALKVGGDVSPPILVYTTTAEYSDEARKAHVQGEVLLSIIVDIDGRPKSIAVIRPLGHGLDEEAIRAVRQWRFKPSQKNGQPVPVQMNIQVNFNL